MNGAALVTLEAVLGADGADVEFTGGKNQVLAICGTPHTGPRSVRGHQNAHTETHACGAWVGLRVGPGGDITAPSWT